MPARKIHGKQSSAQTFDDRNEIARSRPELLEVTIRLRFFAVERLIARLTNAWKKPPATPAVARIFPGRAVMHDGLPEDLCPRRAPANDPFIRYRNMEILPR